MLIKRALILTVVLAVSLTACRAQQAAGDSGAAPSEVQAASREQATSVLPIPGSEASAALLEDSIGSLASCPVTAPPATPFIPPAPYPKAPLGDYFYTGTPALWTALPADGIWSDLPWTGHGYTQKMVWWRDGYDSGTEPEPALSLDGQRLDATSFSFHTSRASNATSKDIGTAMMVGFEIPSAGCWQITAIYQQSELSIVVWVGP